MSDPSVHRVKKTPFRRVTTDRTAEVCEFESPDCGPVRHYDADGIPLCVRCYRAMVAEYARQPNCSTCNGRVMLFDGSWCPDCDDGKDWSVTP